MSQNRRNRRKKNKLEKPKELTVTKKDRLCGTLVIAGIFIVGFIVYFFDVIFYFFYMLFSDK
ncbi:hypothetical protein DHD32_21110 [Arenibacter sp. TNZ]|nr:hypothetical protein [Arenibacter sp. TNZ]